MPISAKETRPDISDFILIFGFTSHIDEGGSLYKAEDGFYNE
jgi:hypothetical protein